MAAIISHTIMADAIDNAAHLKLQTWMSSSFPTGAYSCSHGMETAITDGRLLDASGTLQWLQNILHHGSLWNDAILLSHAWRAVQAADNVEQLIEVNQLSLALQAGAERYRETTQLGTAFLKAAHAWPETEQFEWRLLGSDLSFPIVVGVLGTLHGLPLNTLCASTLQSSLSNLAWIATRLIPLGQSECLSMIAALESDITTVTSRATSASLDDLGGCAVLCDIASLQHETLNSRVCLT